MILPDYDSPTALKTFLDEREMAMQKKFGQNFLVNGVARKRLIDALDIEDKMNVWEVGPGLGAMTKEILDRGACLTAFEIDRGFASVLKEIFIHQIQQDTFKLVEGDVLKTWKKELDDNAKPARFFGNLPYNIAATIIADTISMNIRFDKAVVTVQKEVAERMTAKPGTENYSSFSVLCQWAYNVTNIMDLAGGSFWPKPNVGSRAVKMVLNPNFPRCINPSFFMKMQRSLFLQRRKTIKNNLVSFTQQPEKVDKILEILKIDPKIRAERLSIEDLLRLSDTCVDILEI